MEGWARGLIQTAKTLLGGYPKGWWSEREMDGDQKEICPYGMPNVEASQSE
jgi:hypothetical protein